MRHLVELPVGDAQTVSVEIEQAADGLGDVGRAGQVADRATRSLGEMLAGVRPVAESFLGAFAGMASVPDEISLEYGLSLSADANLVIATTAAQANFKVTLTWRTPPASGLEGGSFPAAPEVVAVPQSATRPGSVGPEAMKSAILRIYAAQPAANGERVPVGVGFLVSDEFALTCAHVVYTALGLAAGTQPHEEAVITADLPLLSTSAGATECSRRASKS